MKVLILTDYYLPGHRGGGPIQSLGNAVGRLGSRHSFRVITRDRDLGASEPFPGIRQGIWQACGPGSVLYLAPGDLGARALRQAIASTDHDVLWINSVFSVPFGIKPLVLRRLGMLPRRPTIVSPRGELMPGALRVRRHHKRAYLLVARALGLFRGAVWHAAGPVEQLSIRPFAPDDAIHVASDLSTPDVTDVQPPRVKRQGSLKIAFVSRVAPTKNLHGAFAMVTQMTHPAQLDIYGPIDDKAYWSKCERAIAASVPPHLSVTYRGTLRHSDVVPTLANYDLFLLPTFGESYGHVIVEALHAGCPVLISDQTPWRNLEASNAGWDLPLDDVGAFVRRLDRCAEMSSDEYRTWSRGAKAFVLSAAAEEPAEARTEHLLAVAAGRG